MSSSSERERPDHSYSTKETKSALSDLISSFNQSVVLPWKSNSSIQLNFSNISIFLPITNGRAAVPSLENNDLKDARARRSVPRRRKPAVALMSHREKGTRVLLRNGTRISVVNDGSVLGDAVCDREGLCAIEL